MKSEERIVLNRENIKADKLRSLVRKQGLGSKLLDDDTLLKSRRSLVPDNSKKRYMDFWIWFTDMEPCYKTNKKIKSKKLRL